MLALATTRRERQDRDRSAIGLLASIVVILLYASLFRVANYMVTIGGLFVPVVLLFSLRRVGSSKGPLLLGLIFIGWPLLIMLGSNIVGAALTPEPLRFAASYALWAVSVLLLTLACITWSPVQLRWILLAQFIMVFLMAVQFIGARIFSNMIGFEFVAPLMPGDIFDSYLGLNFQSTVRAIGTYYEPSMCARVMGTLCFLDMMRNGRIARNFLFLGLTMIFTQSLGLVVMVVVFGSIVLGRSAREFGIAVIGGSLLAGAIAPIVEQRGSIAQGSNYVRLVAPIETVGWAISNYSLGLPIGSMEELTSKTGYASETGERKVTNGIYEFIIYFGVIGVIAVVIAGIYAFVLLVLGEREFAAALVYVILSTGLSGSFLSIESSLLSYCFLVGAREARWKRILGTRSRGELSTTPGVPVETMS